MQGFPPGPRDYAFGLLTSSRMRADVLNIYPDWHRQYGDTVSFRMGPYRMYVFYHPDQVNEVLTTHAKSMIRLPSAMRVFAQWTGNGVLVAEGKEWIRKRRLVQQAFHPRLMGDYGSTMVNIAQEFADNWKRQTSDGGHVDTDIDRETVRLTLSIICRTMFDTDATEAANELREAVAVLSYVAAWEMQLPLKWPMWPPTKYNRKKRWAMDTVDSVVRRFLNERRDSATEGTDLLSTLLRGTDEDGSRLSEEEVRDEIVTLLLAGHDTTAVAMGWTCYLLAKHGDVCDRCIEEVHALGDKRLGLEDMSRLEFLQATIQESLRIYPPATGTFLRQTTSDLEIGGWNVAKGSLIFLSSFTTQRDERWFPAPLEFDPTRFLPGAEQTNGSWFPFGNGPRVCIGKAFAMAELTLVIATLLQNLKPTLTPDAVDPGLRFALSLRPENPITIRWTSHV